MKKVLLIGGAGYVGTVVTGYLLNAGWSVRTLDLFLYHNNQCVLPFLGTAGYECMYGDFCNPETLQIALTEVTDVVLLAGLVGDPITKMYPDAARAINEIGVCNCIDFLNGYGLDRLIFVSTCSNYGLIEDKRLADETFELKPLSLYASAKVAAERHILGLEGSTDYVPTILRFATAFGLSPRMRFDLTVNEFTLELAQGKQLVVFDAHTWRPYCHVQDFARLIGAVLEAPIERVAFQIFNAGGQANNFTKQGIVDILRSHLPHSNVIHQEHGPDPRNYRVDFRKVREVLGFEPQYTVADGITELLKAIEQHVFEHVRHNRNLHGNYEIDYHL